MVILFSGQEERVGEKEICMEVFEEIKEMHESSSSKSTFGSPPVDSEEKMNHQFRTMTAFLK